jgi:hypothetical protein
VNENAFIGGAERSVMFFALNRARLRNQAFHRTAANAAIMTTADDHIEIGHIDDASP